jgi:preprotein translocase subunit SecA
MMDRIEDETIRFLFFLQAVRGERPHVPGEEDEWAEQAPEPEPEPEPAAKSALVDLTRNIQRKKDREMEMLQFAGGQAGAEPKAQVIKGDKVGRNDPCPCGSGKKYKKCCGS